MKRFSLVLLLAAAICAPIAQAQTGAARPNNQAAPAADKKDDCGCEAKHPPDVLATVNGVKIGIKDIDEPIKEKIKELQNQVVEARKRELDLQINSRLLEAEAKKRGITAAKLIEAEIVGKTVEPTEAEARAFYDQNQSRIPGTFAETKTDIIDYLRDQRQREEASKLAARLRSGVDLKILAASVTAPEKEADRARVFATINGTPITSGDIEDSLKPLIFEVQERVYELRKQQLDLKVNDLLLVQEAQKRKVTTRALLDAEVTPKVKKVTDEDAQAFFDKNKSQLNGDFPQLKPQIIQYLERAEQRKAEFAFAEQLRKSGAVETFLPMPDPPVYQIATDDQPSKGKPDAPVTIVEFTDFQCPSCAKTHPVIETLVQEYGDKVRFVVRDYPLSQHPNAFKAAEAAEAAREQNKYWEYVALLFHNQDALGVEKLKEYATQVGLDRAKFDAALASGKFTEKVQRDLRDGDKAGVNSTPTVFINGKRARERTLEGLRAAIEAALKDGAKK
jgi:protein-disulfide isomerase